MSDHNFDKLMKLAVRDGVDEGKFDLDLQLIGGNRGLVNEDFERPEGVGDESDDPPECGQDHSYFVG